MRLRRSLFATYLGVALLLSVAGGAILYDSLVDEARAGEESRLTVGVRMLAVGLERPGAPLSGEALDDHVDALARRVEGRFTVVGPDGKVLADSEFDDAALAALDNHAGRPEIREAVQRGESRSVRYSRSVGEDLLYRARRIDAGPWEGSVARMAIPATRFSAARAEALREVAFGLGIALVLALIAGVAMARRVADPVGRLVEVAERVREGDLSARARIATGDELEELAGAINSANERLADRIEAAIAERDRLEAVLDGMAEGVVVTDSAGRIDRANAALREMFGVDRPATGRTVLEALRHAEAAEAMRLAARDGEEIVREELRLTYPAERILTLHAAGLSAGGAVGVFHDVTALKRAERVRREFVANVSHELRTPLATLAVHAEEIADPATSPGGRREGAEVLVRQVDRLAELVDDLLELSRIEAEEFFPRRETVDLAALADGLLAEWRPAAEEADIQLRREIEPGLVVEAERTSLRRALANLLENAIKYSPEGAEVRLAAASTDGEVELAVADTGPGIAADDLPRIFERFYRVEKGRARGTGGTGLGLAIVKHVAEAHGGRVAVESAPGSGSTFRIVLPRRAEANREPDPEEVP
ncbi:MAG: ATP-binding protein [Gemmatimonadota bacterium]|nr:ATP-binding protein [Gemmatimonadota bacterium]